MRKNIDLNNGHENLLNRSENIDLYLHDIKKFETISKEEEYRLFQCIEQGDMEARNKIIECNQRFIFAMAKIYANDDKVLDLVGEGNLGLVEAMETYDYRKGNRFLSYAVWFIQRQMHSSVMVRDNMIRQTNASKTMYHINRFKNKFYCENGRWPSEDEVLDMLEEKGIKLSERSDTYEVKINSINTTYDDEDKNALENFSFFTDRTATVNEYENDVDQEYKMEAATAFMSVLNERERMVIEYAFGIGKGREYTNDEIGAELGLSSERARQIKNTALKKMRSAALNYNI